MEKISYGIKIIIYIFYIFIIYITAERYSKKIVEKKTYKTNNETCIEKNDKMKIKLSKFSILVFAVLFGLYSIIVSVRPYASDRGYYARAYGNYAYRYQLPKGYLFITDILYQISKNPDFLFFAFSFMMIFIGLYTYRKFEMSNPYGLLLLLCSLYFIYGFHLLKQGMAVAFGTFSILYILDKKYIRAIIWGIIAILFHEAALIILPLAFILIGAKKRWVRCIEYIFALIFIITFSGVTPYFSDSISSVFPFLKAALNSYFSQENLLTSNTATVLKGIPVYLITIIALMKRKQLVGIIKNYDKYMVLSIYVSMTYLLSSYMYWMYRFGLFGLFFVFMFFGEILKNVSNRKERNIYFLAIYGTTILVTVRYLAQMFFYYGGF